MCARVTIVQVLPGKIDEAIGIFRDSVVPAANEQKGHKGHHLLTDRQNNKGISISLWETEADMTAGESSGHYRQQLAKFKDIFAAPPVREAYEVSVQPKGVRRLSSTWLSGMLSRQCVAAAGIEPSSPAHASVGCSSACLLGGV